MMEQNQKGSVQQPDSAVIFISYAREDRSLASRLDESLRLKGINVRGDWLLVRGESYEAQLRDFILGSDALIFVISPDSARSHACRAEIDRAVEQKKLILPVVFRDYEGEELHPALAAPQWTFLRDTDDFVAGVQGLISAVNTDFDLMPEHRRLLTAAETWQLNNRSRSYLLRKDGLLKAVEWLRRTGENPNKLPKPTSLQSEYILASQRAQTHSSRIAFGVASGIILVLAVLTIFAWAQRGNALAQRSIAETNAKIAADNEQRAIGNAAEAKRQEDIARQKAEEAERQKVKADKSAQEAEESAQEAKHQEGIAKQNEQTARTQQRIAEERRVEANHQRVLAEEATQTERGARSKMLGQQPGREYEGLVVGLQAASFSLNNQQPALPPSVLEGLGTSIWALKRSLPLRGHPAAVRAASFSPDGTRVLTQSGNINNSSIDLWDAADGGLVANLNSEKSRTLAGVLMLDQLASLTISPASFSPDSTRLVTAGEKNLAVIWDARTGQQLFKLEGHTLPVAAATFSSDGKFVVTSGFDHTARVWDVSTGNSLGEIKSPPPSDAEGGNEEAPLLASFSRDGKRVICFEFGRVRVWDRSTGELLKTFLEDKDKTHDLSGVDALAYGAGMFETETKETLTHWLVGPEGGWMFDKSMFSPDGKYVVTLDKHVPVILDVESGQPLASFKPSEEPGIPHQNVVNFAAFSPDGQSVVSADDAGMVKVWEVKSGGLLKTLAGHTDAVHTVRFSPDGRYIVTASEDRTARIWDTSYYDRSLATLHKATDEREMVAAGRVAYPAFSPDGKVLLTADDERGARLWNAENGELLAVLDQFKVDYAAFSLDGSRIVTSGWRDVILWDAQTRKKIVTVGGQMGRGDDFMLAFSPDSRFFLVCFNGGWKMYDARDGKQAMEGKTQKIIAGSIGFTRDGKLIVVGDNGQGTDKGLELYDAQTGKFIVYLATDFFTDDIQALSSDGTLLFTSNASDSQAGSAAEGKDFNPTVREVKTGKILYTLRGHTAKVSKGSFSFDGTRILTAGEDKLVRIWDARDGRLLLTLEGHTGEVNDAQFSPDGRHVLSISRDGTARLWDAHDGHLLAICESAIWGVFSRDGRRFALTDAYSPGKAKIYSADEAELTAEYLINAFKLLRHQREFELVRDLEPLVDRLIPQAR